MHKNLTTITAILLATFLITAHVFADYPGAHPGYLHALSDLRTARAYLDMFNPDVHTTVIMDEIDLAIGQIKAAAIDDGKNLDDHPPIDASLPPMGRYHAAFDLLETARLDVTAHEDNLYAQGLQQRALLHIHAAHIILKDVIAAFPR